MYWLLAVEIKRLFPTDATRPTPKQGPQLEPRTIAPDCAILSIIPSSTARKYISLEAGTTNNWNPLAICLPSKIMETKRKSSNRPEAQAPMSPCCIFSPTSSSTPWRTLLPVSYTIGKTLARSISINRE